MDQEWDGGFAGTTLYTAPEVPPHELQTRGHAGETGGGYSRANSVKTYKSCRSRQELSNEYFLAKFGIDTAENEPDKV